MKRVSFSKKDILAYFIIIALGFFMALGYALFVVRNHFAPAGLNGIAVMIQYKLNFSIGYFSLLINVPLCIFAFFAVDRRFALRTLVFSLSYSLFYLLLSNLDGLSRFQYDAQGVDTIFPVMIAGLISGFCYGCLFRLQSSTGGTDVVSKYLCQKRPALNFFWVSFSINAVVAAISFFVYAKEVNGVLQYDYKPVCLCLLYCFISNFMGNFIIKGTKSAYKLIIVTTHADEIAQEILLHLHHSATRLTGHGIYSHNEKQVLLCVINRHQLIDFEQILKKYDNTFTVVETANETLGNFKKIK